MTTINAETGLYDRSISITATTSDVPIVSYDDGVVPQLPNVIGHADQFLVVKSDSNNVEWTNEMKVALTTPSIYLSSNGTASSPTIIFQDEFAPASLSTGFTSGDHTMITTAIDGVEKMTVHDTYTAIFDELDVAGPLKLSYAGSLTNTQLGHEAQPTTGVNFIGNTHEIQYVCNGSQVARMGDTLITLNKQTSIPNTLSANVLIVPDNTTSIRGSSANSGININGSTVNIFSSATNRFSINSGIVNILNSTLQVQNNAAIAFQPRDVTTATYTLSAQNGVFLNTNATANSIAITIPSSGLNNGQYYKIFCGGATVNTVSLNPSSGVTLYYFIGSSSVTTVYPNSMLLDNNSFYELHQYTNTVFLCHKTSV